MGDLSKYKLWTQQVKPNTVPHVFLYDALLKTCSY